MTEDRQKKKAQFKSGEGKKGFTGKMAALALLGVAVGISLTLYMVLKPGDGPPSSRWTMGR